MAETQAMGGNAAPLASSPSGPFAFPERYESLSELGRGGMGVVYKVRDRETGEVVALKFLKSEIASDQQILERFKNELRLAHKITHRNVARLYEFHRAGDAAYLSMEFVEGQSLRDVLRAGKLELPRAQDIARQLCAGLTEAHRQSIAHRDLKPENVMITADGEVKVMDFGISKSFASGATVTGAIIGTPAYMSPEQAEGKPSDHRADIYALGLILYEMYTGAQAFTGETPVSVALKQIREKPEAPRKVDPWLPKHIEQTILKCLEKNPANRFQSVDEIAHALAGEHTTPSRTIVLPRPTMPQGRRWMAIAAAAVIVLGAAMYWIWWRGHGSDSIQLKLERFTLANGLPVVLSEDHATPTFTLATVYRTGARADSPEQPALSHLTGHMMFAGSPNVAPGELLGLVQSVGGSSQDSNALDADLFWLNLPSNQLELALFLEADRMRGLEFDEAGLDDARNTIIEEARARIDNSAYGQAGVLIREMAFDNPRNRTVGYGDPQTLRSFTAADVKRFHESHYMPANAAIGLAGDFDAKKARQRIEHYFGSIPARPAPPPPNLDEKPRSAEVRRTINAPLAQAPLVMIAYRTPPPSDPDWFVVFGISNLLGGNDASRLQSAVVKGSGVATAVQTLLDDSTGWSLLMFNLVGAPGKDLSQIEAGALQEIDRMGREGVSDAELDRLFTEQTRVRAVQLMSTAARAVIMTRMLAVFQHPEGVNEWDRLLRKVTSDSIKRVIAKYFTPANRSVLYVAPGRAQ